MIKYLGSKRLLIPYILELIASLTGVRTALDLFSGTSRVGHALKRQGLRVHANDHNAYAGVLATCYIQADRERWQPRAERLIAELDQLPGEPGWFTDTYCRRARYLRPENGARVDAIRERIATLELEPELEAIALTSLMEAADRVDSTTGVQMAYLKQWAPRAFRPLALRVPELLPGPGSASCLDALEAARRFEADVAYLDPPYNQHSYLGNYHVWESLVRWDRPEVYGVAMKRQDVRERASRFNRRAEFQEALRALIATVRARYLIVSFSDEGYVTGEDLCAILGACGPVRTIEVPYRRYVGARIGIHNPSGDKVGTPGRLVNVERLFVVEAAAASISRW
ncbi:MAG TPA: DNA adenine methylase [Candidatus Limnocylindria bacterium]|nr:DNA adenine methylase [Candidatus Limnocylindria bacterium]